MGCRPSITHKKIAYLSKAFVDTTILCDALGLSSLPKAQTTALTALAQFKQTEAPIYGLKELRSGPLASWMLVYNVLVASKSIEEATDRLNRQSSFRPRRASIVSRALISGLLAVMQSIKVRRKMHVNFDEKAELENHLLRCITKFWRKRQSVVSRLVQPLACFVDDELELVDKQVRFAGASAGCVTGASCGAAIELKKHPIEINKILVALRPPKKRANEAPEKRETSRRRAALKEVLARAPNEFPRKDCPALGDAYFCIMAPTDCEILTTNRSDFEPMAEALGKKLKSP